MVVELVLHISPAEMSNATLERAIAVVAEAARIDRSAVRVSRVAPHGIASSTLTLTVTEADEAAAHAARDLLTSSPLADDLAADAAVEEVPRIALEVHTVALRSPAGDTAGGRRGGGAPLPMLLIALIALLILIGGAFGYHKWNDARKRRSLLAHAGDLPWNPHSSPFGAAEMGVAVSPLSIACPPQEMSVPQVSVELNNYALSRPTSFRPLVEDVENPASDASAGGDNGDASASGASTSTRNTSALQRARNMPRKGRGRRSQRAEG